MPHYDVALVGLGAMGSASALQLARRGARVIGFDRFTPPHPWGSSHGQTRVTRLAIGEGEHLTPLATRSHQLWREIEQESGFQLLLEAGLVIISSERNAAQTHVSGFFPRTIAAAEKFGIAHELLDASGIRSRWPQFKVQEDEAAYFEPGGGLVRPELCIGAQLLLATRHGAEVRTDEPVLALSWTGDCVILETARGSYSADRIILAAGAWLPELLPKYAHLFRVYRQVQVWFETEDATAFTRDRFPVFIWELQNSARGLYGFPALDGERAIKVASEEFVVPTAPAETDREISAAELEVVRGLVTANLRGIRSRCVRATTCLYTVTPDFGFIIGTHPESERVIIASACSGHGFKHSPAIGEALANLGLGQPAQLDLQPFRLARFEDVPNRRAPTGPS